MAIRAKGGKLVGSDIEDKFNKRYDRLVMKKIREKTDRERERCEGDLESIQSIDSLEAYYDKEGRRQEWWRYLHKLELRADQSTREAQQAGLKALAELGIEKMKVFMMNGNCKSQREIATELGCSVGKVNSILKELEGQGFRVMRQPGRATYQGNPKKKAARKKRKK